MPITFDEIAKFDNGSHFYTADLHIHSVGASSDVTDTSLTPEAIVEAAIQEGISILCLTDHNTEKNTQASIDYAQRYAGHLLVLAGVELSTAHGHLLAYFAPDKVQAVRTLLGQLNIVGVWGARDSHTAMSMADVAARVDALDGVAVAAHIDREKIGFEKLADGYPNWKKDIILSSGLFGLEVDDPKNLIWYSDQDDKSGPGGERRKLIAQRELSSATAGRIQLAHVQNSDAHTMADFIGHAQKRELTRFKLNELSFDALRTAFVDPEARVRATAVLPTYVPRILGMQVSGGFLDGQTYHFSDNLNCFIGGRGAGKSTAVKAIAYGLGVDNHLKEYDNCPDNVVVYAEDNAGIRYRYERNRGADPLVLAKESKEVKDVPADAFRIEYYGQGELSKVAEDPLRRPDLLQDFLDRHIVLTDLRAREMELINLLSDNSAQLIPIESTAAQLPAKTEDLKKIDTKLDVAKVGKVKELAEFQISVAAEKGLRNALVETKKMYDTGLSLSKFLRDYGTMSAGAGQLTGDAESAKAFQAASAAIASANTLLNEEEAKINASLKTSASNLQTAIDRVTEVHKAFDQNVADRIGELRKKGLSGSITELNNLITQRGLLAAEIARIQAQQLQLQQLRAERQGLLASLAVVRQEILARRKAQVTNINSNLSRTIKDYSVIVYYDEKGDGANFKRFISDTVRGTWFQEEAITNLCSVTSPEDLAKLIAAQDVAAIAALANIGDTRARQILEKFRPLTVLHSLETMWKEPCPVIKVISKGSPPRQIPVNQLSDGQKHTILLTIAMLAESNLPLIIDQPEDDLDNAFIFSSIVTTLRSIKEMRQVIVVTHNANLAVLGDSELIFPMRRKGDNGEAFDRGGIDRADTRRAVQDILEGGPLAFRKRKELYGY